MSTSHPDASVKHHPMPFVRLEVVLMALVDEQLQVLLVKRAQAPQAGRWALPGGVLRIDLDKTLDAAARRVMNERLGLDTPFVRQLCAVGGPTRDPRAPWALSVVYRALARADALALQAGKRVEALAWRPADAAAQDKTLAFDHAGLIGQAVATTRAEVQALDLPAGVLPATFTLGELQTACEHLLGHRLDKSSFRRRLAEREVVEALPGEMRGGAYRPAQVYRLGG